MSINALYIYTSTAFRISTPSIIEQLVAHSGDSYTVTPRSVSGQFTLDPGVYRYAFDVTLTPVDRADCSASRGDTLSGFLVVPMETKSGGGDPKAHAAAIALNIPISSITAFLMDAEPAVTLAPAATAGQHAHR